MGIRITNSGDMPTMWVYGTIGDKMSGVTADAMRNSLAEIPMNRSFQMRIFSDGGSFDQAMAMHSLISQRGKKVHGIVDGLAASAASLLLQATGRRSMVEHSRQMMHEVHASLGDDQSFDAKTLRSFADQMDSTNDTLVSIYSKNWKGSEAELRQALADETWMSAADSVKCGMADDVVAGARIAARVNSNLFNYRNVPEDVILAPGPFVPPWVGAMHDKLTAVMEGIA